MRLWEGLAAAGAAAATVLGGTPVAPALLGVAVIVQAVSFATENPRWQTAPTAVALCMRARAFCLPACAPVELTLCAAAGALGKLFPVPELPAPTGPHAVSYVDTDINGVPVRVWYPAAPRPRAAGGGGAKGGGEPQVPRYIMGDDASVPVSYMEFMGLNFVARALRYWVLAHNRHATVGATLLGGDAVLPLVVLSHSNGGTREVYTVLCGELASRGVVVVVPEHKDGSCCMYRHPDGTRAGYDMSLYDLEAAAPREEYLAARGRQMDVRAAELGVVLDGCRSVDAGEVVLAGGAAGDFSGRLQCRRAVVMGHSFGGATAMAATVRGLGFAASVTLDPAVCWGAQDLKDALVGQSTPEKQRALASVPTLAIYSEHFIAVDQREDLFGGVYYKQLFHPVAKAFERGTVGRGSAVFGIRGGGHYAQCDVCFFLPSLVQRALLMNGPAPAERQMRTVVRAVVPFVNAAADGFDEVAEDPAWRAALRDLSEMDGPGGELMEFRTYPSLEALEGASPRKKLFAEDSAFDLTKLSGPGTPPAEGGPAGKARELQLTPCA